MTQQARNIVETFVERTEPIRFLIHDRDSKFTAAFDEVFRSEGIRAIRAPVQAPNANAFAERWIGSVRRECLDRLLIVNRRDLERVLPVYIEHYNAHRPHRSLQQRPPTRRSQTDSATRLRPRQRPTSKRPGRTHPRIQESRLMATNRVSGTHAPIIKVSSKPGEAHFDLSRFMGASLAMIDRHYGHLARDGREHAVALLDTYARDPAAWTQDGRRIRHRKRAQRERLRHH